jgi:hypothetical protein
VKVCWLQLYQCMATPYTLTAGLWHSTGLPGCIWGDMGTSFSWNVFPKGREV